MVCSCGYSLLESFAEVNSTTGGSMNKVNVRAFANFAYELGQQTELTRTGWRLIGATREPLGCHVARAAQIGFILAIMEGSSRDFAQEVATALLFHDLPENRTGDADKVMARYVVIDEKRALEEQTEGLGAATEIIRWYWDSIEERKIDLGIIAKDADYLECAVRARELEVVGHQFAENWITNVKGALRTTSAKLLMTELIMVHPHEWWRGLKKLS